MYNVIKKSDYYVRVNNSVPTLVTTLDKATLFKQGKQFNDADGFAFLVAMTEDLLVEQRKELQVYQDELDSRGSVW